MDENWVRVLSALASVQVDYPEIFGEDFTDDDVLGVVETLKRIAGSVEHTPSKLYESWAALQRQVSKFVYQRINAIRPKIHVLPQVDTAEVMGEFERVKTVFTEAIWRINSGQYSNVAVGEELIIYDAAKRYLQHREREAALQEWSLKEWHVEET